MLSPPQEFARRSALFFLPGLDAILLEKVIAKMDSGSYFRLQQTCHGMYNFIRRSQNISVYLDGSLDPDWNGVSWMNRNNRYQEERAIKNIDVLYGVRLRELNLWDRTSEEMEKNLLPLEANKISCKRLSLRQATYQQLEQLLTFLVPEKIKVDSFAPPTNDEFLRPVDTGRNYMALFRARQLKEVHLCMNHRNLLVVAPQLMAQFSWVYLDVELWDNGGLPGLTSAIKSILKILQFGVFPQLRQFRFEIWCGGPMPELPVFEEAFRGLPLENSTYDLVPDIVMHPGLELYGIVPHYTRKYKALMRLPPGNIEEFCGLEITELRSQSETNGCIAADVLFPRD